MDPNPSQRVIGVDLGGTKIEAVVAERGAGGRALSIVSRRRVPTEADRGYEAVLDAAAGIIREAAASEGLDLGSVPIGMGMPGGTTREGGW